MTDNPPSGGAKPPVLVGRHDRPFGVMLGAVGLFTVFALTGFLSGVVPEEGNGIYTSQVVVSEAGKAGRAVYRSEGCASCHTQQVRPIVADVGLGGVTVSDSNQVLGWRRYGPDLAHVGSRAETDLTGILTGAGSHPSFSYLSEEDLANLVVYLSESK